MSHVFAIATLSCFNDRSWMEKDTEACKGEEEEDKENAKTHLARQQLSFKVQAVQNGPQHVLGLVGQGGGVSAFVGNGKEGREGAGRRREVCVSGRRNDAAIGTISQKFLTCTLGYSRPTSETPRVKRVTPV